MFLQVFIIDNDELAFDISAAPEILKHAHCTTLIQQVFNTDGKPPSFADQASLSVIRKGAVLFHRCKDESLIERLREQNAGVAQLVEQQPPKLPVVGSMPTP